MKNPSSNNEISHYHKLYLCHAGQAVSAQLHLQEYSHSLPVHRQYGFRPLHNNKKFPPAFTDLFFPFEKIDQFSHETSLFFSVFLPMDMIFICFDIEILTGFLFYREFFHMGDLFFDRMHLVHHSCFGNCLSFCLDGVCCMLIRMYFSLAQYFCFGYWSKPFPVWKMEQFIQQTPYLSLRILIS